MDIYVYDIEVFKYDWLVVFKKINTDEYTIIWNDNDLIRKFMKGEKILAGFNNKHYDNIILKAINCGADNALVKDINDYIISGKQGFGHWFIKKNKFWFDSFDIKDDMQMGLSLKAIEGHLHLNIRESSVPFDIDRPLNENERIETEFYCKHDVDCAEEVIKVRKNYLNSKLILGRMKGIDDAKALSMTNAKLTATLLGAVRVERKDGRDYEYPPNLDKSLIPKEILDFFEQIHDLSIPDEKLFKKNYLDIVIGGCLCRYAWGGVHGSLKGYFEESTDTRVIQNRDVSSLYPALLIEYNYISRNCEDPRDYRNLRDMRLNAKKTNDKPFALALKNPLNATSGAMENEYNDLYDPRNARSMRISGQLLLTMLLVSLLKACKSFKPLNFNTDGLMYSVDKSDLPMVEKVCKAWETITHFELETDEIQKVWIKDVNNLLFVTTDGKTKAVGGYLTSGISEKGAWNINNNYPIVKKALIDYFTKNIPVETTIDNCNDIFQFQMIAKAGIKYREAYHLVDGIKQPVQKVNRVYATSDPRYGKLFKVKAETDQEAKIDSLPEHCIIDNDNHLSIGDIDKEFYKEVARNRINDFLGIENKKPKKERKTKNMATSTKDITVTPQIAFLQKLFTLQNLMDEFEWEKDGKNMNQKYKFISEKQYKQNFKIARRKAGLLWTCVCVGRDFIPSISEKMHLVMGDFIGSLIDPDTGEHMEFTFSGSGSDNGDKALYKAYTGGLKFFLANQYLVAEGNDPENDSDDNTPAATSNKNTDTKPATKAEREEIKGALTNPEDQATKLQIDALKKSLKMLREVDPNQEEFISEIATKTDGFTNITKKACETLIGTIGDMIDKAKGEK